uniref:MFS transporter n=1 Tax=uncultured Caulobacter sp. TaxID=158749 RepID=UPI0025D2F17B|nr:MFS transporter [uncultured Caulobacter sp.]
MENQAQAARLPIGTKLFYGFGSIAYGVKDGAFKSFLLIYYNQVVGLPAGLVASAILLALVADSLLDPLIGQMSDGLRSRWGRRHPFMYASALPTAGSFLLLFMPPADWSQGALFGYIVVTSILVRSFVALYEIPSSALGPELSADYDERTAIMAYRYMFAIVGGALLYIVTLKVFLRPDAGHPVGLLNPDGWWRYAITAAVIMALSILVSAAGTHGRIATFRQPPARPRRSLPTVLGEMRQSLGHGSFLALMAYGVIKFTGTGVVSALALYFATYWWKLSSGQIALLALDALIGSLLALPLAPRLSRLLGKKRVAIVLLAVTVVLGLLPFALRMAGWFPAEGSRLLVPALLAIQTLYWTCGVVSVIMITAMLSDVIDDSAVRTGRRAEGLFFAANSIVQKCVSGLGVFVSGLLLSVVAFPRGASPATVDPQVVTRLVLVYAPTLVVLYGVGMACLLGYRITRERHAENVRLLAEREAGAAQAPEAKPAVAAVLSAVKA